MTSTYFSNSKCNSKLIGKKALYIFVNLFFAGRDTLNAQKEEIEITKENVLYAVPTSLIKVAESDTPMKQMNVKMKENISYKVPSQMMKMTECQPYEVPSQRMRMTECQAYGPLPNKP